MTDDKPPKTPSPLIQINDVLGLSAPGKRLMDAIMHGLGEWSYPWRHARNTRADVGAFRQWAKALRKEGLSIASADLSLEERALLRVSAQELRRQEHREAIAVQAVKEFQHARLDQSNAEPPSIELEWLDRFWRLAQDVSNSDFQSLWARILARQSTGNAKHSARCLETLSTFSRDEAALLEKIATVTTVARGEDGASAGFVMVSAQGCWPNSQSPTLEDMNRSVVRHVGSVHSEVFGPIGIYVQDGWAHMAAGIVQNQAVHVTIAQRRYRIDGYPSELLPNPNLQLDNAVYIGSGTELSAVGSEIISLIQAAPDEEYVRLMGAAFACVGLTLTPDE